MASTCAIAAVVLASNCRDWRFTITYLLEYWKPVVGWEGIYEVSSTGRIKRVKRKGRHAAGSMVTGSLHSRGYWVVGLTRDNKMKHFYVHRVVCAAFIGPCPKGEEVNHLDANKLNNRLSNLEYLTHPANMRHAHGAGIFRKGFKRKLKPDEIREIRAFELSVTCETVGAIYGVSKNTIARVRSGAAWKWVV